MGLPLEDGVFTTSLINDTLTITEGMGVKKISIFNTTSTAGTILGTQNLGASTPSAVNVSENDTTVITATQGSIIKDLTITSPVGCNLTIIALV